MRIAALLLLASLAAFGQAKPVVRAWVYAGSPTAGDCTSATEGNVAINTTTDPDTLYDCIGSGAGYAWVERGAAPGGGVANYETSFTAQTSVTVTGATHGFGHAKIIVGCYDNSSPRQQIEPGSVTVDTSTYDVVISFSVSTTGACVLNGSGGSGAVSSVFSRTGAVTAQSGDYTAAQVTNAVSTAGSYADPAWITSLAGSKITGTTGSNSVVLATGPSMTGIIMNEQAAPSAPSANQSHVYADDSDGITVLRAKDSTGIVSQINRDVFFIARNTSGSTIAAGKAVYITGSTTQTPNISLAQANSTATAAYGITAESINNNAFGRVYVSGRIDGFDTSSFTEGQVLYLSGSVGGGFTTTAPTWPNIRQHMAVVANSHATQGALLVQVRAPLVEELLNLSYATHDNSKDPTADEKQALAGTDGAPSSTNKYVTNSDSRMTNSRAPTAHASSHQNGGGDEVATATPGANAIPKAGAGGTIDAGWVPTLNQSTSGNAATATALETPRTINGVSFNGTANITVTAAANTLTTSTLASGVTSSSLTSFGTSPTIVTPIIGAYTVAGLPAAGTANRVAIVTDAATQGSCTSGGGSARSWCRDTGAAWEPIGDGGGGGGGLGDPGGNGIVARTALNTTINRTITGTTNRLTVTNGDGVSGNPTLDVGSNFGELVTAGSAGIAAYNAGSATTSARSDHTHLVVRNIQWFFPGQVVAGVQVARALIPGDVTNCILTNSRITVGSTASGSSTYNIQRCTTGNGDCTATANIYSSAVTLNSSTQSVAGGTPNTTTVSASDAFRVNLVTVGSGLQDVTISMAYKCETVN